MVRRYIYFNYVREHIQMIALWTNDVKKMETHKTCAGWKLQDAQGCPQYQSSHCSWKYVLLCWNIIKKMLQAVHSVSRRTYIGKHQLFVTFARQVVVDLIPNNQTFLTATDYQFSDAWDMSYLYVLLDTKQHSTRQDLYFFSFYFFFFLLVNFISER